MVLTGIWIAGSNVTEPHPFVSVCVCVCVSARALHPSFTARFHSIPAVSVGVLLFIVHTACYHTLCSLSCAHSLGVWRERGLSTELPEKEINKGGGEHLQTGVNSTSATLKIDDAGPRFSGSQETSGPQRLITPFGELQDLENGWHCSWLPDFTNASRRTGSCPVL